MRRALAITSLAILVAIATWVAFARGKPVPARALVAYLADTNDVASGTRIQYAGVTIGEVTSARRIDSLTRIEFRLTRTDAPLRADDRLRRVVSPLGFTSRLVIAPGRPDAPPFTPADSLAPASTLNWADTLGRATDAVPGLVRDVRRGVDEVKKRPHLYQP